MTRGDALNAAWMQARLCCIPAPDVDAVILTANANEPVLLVPDKQPFVGRQSAVRHVLHETYDLFAMQISCIGQ
jgi:hypothetical protein